MVTAMTLFMGVGGFAGVQAADARSYGTDVSKYQGVNGNLAMVEIALVLLKLVVLSTVIFTTNGLIILK